MQLRDLVKRLDTISEGPLPTGTMPVALDLKSLDDLKRTNVNLYKQILQNNPQLAMADVGVSVDNTKVPATGGTPATGNQQQIVKPQITATTQNTDKEEPQQTVAPGQQPIGKNSSSQVPPPPMQKRPQEGFEKFTDELNALSESLLNEEDTQVDNRTRKDTPPEQTRPDATFGDFMSRIGGLPPQVNTKGERRRFTYDNEKPTDAENNVGVPGQFLRSMPDRTTDVGSALFADPLKGIPSSLSTRWNSQPPGKAEWGMDPYNLQQDKLGSVIDSSKNVDDTMGYGGLPALGAEAAATLGTNYLVGKGLVKGTQALGNVAADKFGDWRSNVNMSKSGMEALIVKGAEKRERDWLRDPANKGKVQPSWADFYDQSKHEISTKLSNKQTSNREKIDLSKKRDVPEPKGVRDPIKLDTTDIGGRKKVEVSPAQIDALEKSAKWDPNLKKFVEKEPGLLARLGNSKLGKTLKALGVLAVGTTAMTTAGAVADPTSGEAGTDLMAARRAAREKAIAAKREKEKQSESFELFLADMNALTEELIQEDWKDDTKAWLKDTGNTLSDPQTYVNLGKNAAAGANAYSRHVFTGGGMVNQPFDAIDAGANYVAKKIAGKPTTFGQEYKNANARTQDAVNATNAFSRSALNSLTFGGGDYAEAGLDYALDKAQGKDAEWVDKLDKAYAKSNQAGKDYPNATLAGDVAGNVIPFGVGYKAAGLGLKAGAKYLPKVANLASKAPKTSRVAGEITKIGGGLTGDEVVPKIVKAVDPDNVYAGESLDRIIALTKGTTK